jgi:two-component system response regulator
MSDNTVEILLVEDDPNDVELTLHAFQRHNLANRVKVVRDGQEALDYLLGPKAPTYVPPRVILLDLKLPKVNGLAVLRAIRETADTATLPVVVLTSSREESDLIESYDLGVNSYIVKPIEFEKFVETVQSLGWYWLLLNEAPPVAR